MEVPLKNQDQRQLSVSNQNLLQIPIILQGRILPIISSDPHSPASMIYPSFIRCSNDNNFEGCLSAKRQRISCTPYRPITGISEYQSAGKRERGKDRTRRLVSTAARQLKSKSHQFQSTRNRQEKHCCCRLLSSSRRNHRLSP